MNALVHIPPLQPEQPDPLDVKIYGLTILERTLQACRQVGVERIALVNLEGRAREEHLRRFRAALPAGESVEVRLFPEPQSAMEWLDPSEATFLFGAPYVVSPADLNALKKGARDHPVRSPDSGLVFFPPGWKLPAFPQGQGGEGEGLEEAPSRNADVLPTVVPFEGPQHYCQAVRRPEDLRNARHVLLRSLIKPTDGWVSRHLNRPISLSITRLLAPTPITPNQFTVLTGLLGLLTGIFMALGGYWNWLIGAGLFHLTSVLDGVDGELARLKFKSSPFGQWLDTLVDNLSYLAGLGGLIIGIFRTGASEPVLYAGVLAVVFALAALGSLYLYLLRYNKGGTLLNVEYSFQEGSSTFDRVMQVAAAFGKRDLFALVFFILAVFGQLPLALVYVCIMAAFVFGFSIQAHRIAARKAAG